MVMHGPEYERQVADARKQGLTRAAIVLPFAVVGVIAAIWVSSTVQSRLAVSLYEPMCRETCAAHQSSSRGYRLGGRGSRGKVDCECPEAADGLWQRADLSRGSSSDRALHSGGQEAFMFATWFLLVIPGLVISSRVTRSPKR